jgi:hypothetical protein
MHYKLKKYDVTQLSQACQLTAIYISVLFFDTGWFEVFKWPAWGFFISWWEGRCAVVDFIEQWRGGAGVCVPWLSISDALPWV